MDKTDYLLDVGTTERVARASATLEILAFAGALALGALVRLPLPFTPVPLTLQTLPVLLAGFAIGPTRAAAGALLYAALGLMGAPLFAASFGPTFGYLLSFAIVPAVVSRFRVPATGILAGTLVVYAFGASWLCLWAHCSLWQGILLGVLPFVPGDLLKAFAACRLVRWVRS